MITTLKKTAWFIKDNKININIYSNSINNVLIPDHYPCNENSFFSKNPPSEKVALNCAHWALDGERLE